MKKRSIVLPPEWGRQSGVQMAWPHMMSDWAQYLDEAQRCFAQIACEIAKREFLLVVTTDIGATMTSLAACNQQNIRVCEVNHNDTWCRDFGGITIFDDGRPVVMDFRFNGWGLKFAANHDNLVTQKLFKEDLFSDRVQYENCLNFILEGGGIESDGQGTILTTSECLMSPNRNGEYSRKEIEERIMDYFGAKRVVMLDNGYLQGDDTDSHIDTLARFCGPQTIAYVSCDDETDPHFDALKKMEAQLQGLRTLDGNAYRLVGLPMADPVYYDGERLPATYANFLIINGAVLMPSYDSPKDSVAQALLAEFFPDREIIAIDCSVLIRQHGSLHCLTMQYPEGVLK